MIELSDELMFAAGGRRYCFLHPGDQERCIKTLSPAGDPATRRKKAPWHKRLRPLANFDDNLREWASFQEMERYGDEVWAHFPRCYGLEPTNRGLGIVTDLIRDENGCVSKTVRQMVQAQGKSDLLKEALEMFFDILLSRRVITRDILDHNLVVKVGAAGYTIVMIDGFGSSEGIPLSRWSKRLGSRKVARKIARCKKRYGF